MVSSKSRQKHTKDRDGKSKFDTSINFSVTELKYKTFYGRTIYLIRSRTQSLDSKQKKGPPRSMSPTHFTENKRWRSSLQSHFHDLWKVRSQRSRYSTIIIQTEICCLEKSLSYKKNYPLVKLLLSPVLFMSFKKENILLKLSYVSSKREDLTMVTLGP